MLELLAQVLPFGYPLVNLLSQALTGSSAGLSTNTPAPIYYFISLLMLLIAVPIYPIVKEIMGAGGSRKHPIVGKAIFVILTPIVCGIISYILIGLVFGGISTLIQGVLGLILAVIASLGMFGGIGFLIMKHASKIKNSLSDYFFSDVFPAAINLLIVYVLTIIFVVVAPLFLPFIFLACIMLWGIKWVFKK